MTGRGIGHEHVDIHCSILELQHGLGDQKGLDQTKETMPSPLCSYYVSPTERCLDIGPSEYNAASPLYYL